MYGTGCLNRLGFLYIYRANQYNLLIVNNIQKSYNKKYIAIMMKNKKKPFILRYSKLINIMKFICQKK